jgi:hypothetical protein
MIRLSKRGEVWPQFLYLPTGIAGESQLEYVQRYVRSDIISTSRFQVVSGQMHIDSFDAEAVKCLSLVLSKLSHFSCNWK